MKKALLTTMLFAVLAGCSKDDDQPVPVVPVIVNPCEITIYHMGGPNNNGLYEITYGATHATEEVHEVSEATFNYYKPKFLAGDRCWTGTHD